MSTRSSARRLYRRVAIEALEDRCYLSGDGLEAAYFSNANLTGNATIDRVDPQVNFFWNGAAPSPLVPATYFSARWTGKVKPQYSETYTFYTDTDDGERLWVNGQQLVNDWVPHGLAEHSGTITLQAGQLYDIKMEYFQNTAGSAAYLYWSSPSTPKQIIPTANLYSMTGLSAVGNQLQTSDGRTVRLAGVNVPSLEWSNAGENVLQSLTEAVNVWKSNVIRLPLCEDRWFGHEQGQSDGGASYRAVVDSVLEQARQMNVYVILDLHWSDGGAWDDSWGDNRQYHSAAQFEMPDANSTLFWSDASARYANNPHALFGLYNEPHDVPWATWLNGGAVSETHKITINKVDYYYTYNWQAPGLQQLTNSVRATGANNLVVVGGLGWGYDLSGVLTGSAITDTASGRGVVYDTHVYPWKSNWDTSFGNVSRTYPVIAGECGHTGEAQYEPPAIWDVNLLNYFDAHGMDWTGWALHPGVSPKLVSDWNYTPTPEWGVYAYSRLLSYQGLPAPVPSPFPGFANFSSTTGLAFNGYGSGATTYNNSLRLVDNAGSEARSAWWNQTVDVSKFSTSFSFLVSGNNQADGFTFAIQNGTTTALGGTGNQLGYLTGSGAIPNSVALAFDIYTNNSHGSQMGLYINGTGSLAAVGGNVNFHAGDTINVHLNYDGATLYVTLTDAANPTKTCTTTYSLNLSQAIGASTAYIGFTASTGGQTADIDISKWTYLNSSEPVFANFASTTGLVSNGYGAAPLTSGTNLRLADNANSEARSVWWSQKVGVGGFTNDFSFLVSGDKNADGFTFCVQNAGTATVVGATGDSLGYATSSGGIPYSMALEFDIYTSGTHGSNMGLYTNGTGTRAAVGGGVNFHAGDTINVHMNYNGATLTVTLTDAVIPADTYTTSYTVNLTQIVGGSSAYVGFTAGTGGQTANIDITNWTYRDPPATAGKHPNVTQYPATTIANSAVPPALAASTTSKTASIDLIPGTTTNLSVGTGKQNVAKSSATALAPKLTYGFIALPSGVHANSDTALRSLIALSDPTLRTLG